MKLPGKAVSVLMALLSLLCLMPVLGGCHKDESSNDPGYYNGKDFKGHGAGPVSTTGTTSAPSNGRKGGE